MTTATSTVADVKAPDADTDEATMPVDDIALPCDLPDCDGSAKWTAVWKPLPPCAKPWLIICDQHAHTLRAAWDRNDWVLCTGHHVPLGPIRLLLNRIDPL